MIVTLSEKMEKNKESNKIVFFEEINPALHSVIKKYIKGNFTIYTSKIHNKCKKHPTIKKYIEKKRIMNVSELTFDYSLICIAAYYAHENIDYFFNKYYRKTASIKLMERLLQFSNIKDMYVRELLIHLGNLYNFELQINDIIKNNKKLDEIHFISSVNFKFHVDGKSLLDPKIKVIKLKDFRQKLHYVRERFKKVVFLVSTIIILLNKFGGISNNKQRKKFKVGIMVNHSKNIFSMNYYFLESFIIDEKELPKEDVLFIDDTNGANAKEYDKRGYNYVMLNTHRETISKDMFLNQIFKRFIPIWFKTAFLSIFEDPLIVDVNRMILSDYIKWSIFTDNYDIKNYVKNLLPDNISKTHILSQANIKTWLCYSDCTSIDFHIDWDEKKKNQTLFSFIYYDALVAYGNIIERYFKKHRNFIKEYVKVGIFHSQIICEIKNRKLMSPLSGVLRNKKMPKKIISVFDSTVSEWGCIKKKEGVNFGNDFLKLLEDFPDAGIIFKAKKELEITPFLVPVYKKLKDHERCFFFTRYEREGISALDAVAQSDLVISAAYTSTTAEALGAKVKAIYYEPGGRDLGNKYYFNRIPNFVAHDYDELKRLVNYWLYEVTDKEFEKFLNKYVKDEMDPYLDGKALTRLRKILMK